MSNSNFCIFSVFHKPFIIPNVNYVVPIQAGKAISQINLEIKGDEDGDNISKLNPHFCELTVLYNVWKNKLYAANDYWGLAHYRRYLTLQLHWTKIKKKNLYYLKATAIDFKKVFTQKFYTHIKAQLLPQSIIIPMPVNVVNKAGNVLSIKEHYFTEHDKQGWAIMEKIITEKYPAYLADLNAIADNTTIIAGNIMIAHKNFWNTYLTWLFDIVFEIYKIYTIPQDAYQARAIGFLSERLFNIYLHHNKQNIETHYLPVAFFN